MSLIKQHEIKTVKCPYMPQHIMPEGSLLNHLSKCSATNKHLFTKCKYNPIHVYPNNMIEQHYKKCKSKAQFQKHQDSNDDWGVDEDEARNQQKTKQDNNLSQSIAIDQSSITLRSDSDSEEMIDMESDDEDFEETQQKLQSMSIASKKNDKSKILEPSSCQFFTISQASESKPSKTNISKIESKQDKKNQSISCQTKKESSRNESSRFEYEESEPEEKTKPKKKGNQTLQSFTESEKSRGNSSKINQKNKASKKKDDDSDVQVADF